MSKTINCVYYHYTGRFGVIGALRFNFPGRRVFSKSKQRNHIIRQGNGNTVGMSVSSHSGISIWNFLSIFRGYLTSHFPAAKTPYVQHFWRSGGEILALKREMFEGSQYYITLYYFNATRGDKKEVVQRHPPLLLFCRFRQMTWCPYQVLGFLAFLKASYYVWAQKQISAQ